MRPVFAAIAALILTACTPAELAALRYADRPPARAVPCSEWAGAARLAGFSEEELPTILTLEWRESRCQPWAVSRTDDWGNAQIHGSWVGALCRAAIACNRVALLNPGVNARAARYVYLAQGWRAWATYR